jgi:TonB family protein
MHDRVAEILAQRATLDRGTGVGVAFSILLHGALMGAVVYAALHAAPPEAATMVSIQFAKMPAAPSPARRTERRAEPAPKIEEPKIVEPKPVVEKKPETPKKPEKNTVPLSPFGQSTKRGSETPAATPPPPTDNRPSPTGPDIAVGGSGVTGIEGGDFPYALYLQGMHRRIGGNWIRPTVTGATVVVYFRILRDGTIAEARVATPSGNATFDRAALSAVRSSSPLNPLPFAYPGRELGIYLTFR